MPLSWLCQIPMHFDALFAFSAFQIPNTRRGASSGVEFATRRSVRFAQHSSKHHRVSLNWLRILWQKWSCCCASCKWCCCCWAKRREPCPRIWRSSVRMVSPGRIAPWYAREESSATAANRIAAAKMEPTAHTSTGNVTASTCKVGLLSLIFNFRFLNIKTYFCIKDYSEINFWSCIFNKFLKKLFYLISFLIYFDD